MYEVFAISRAREFKKITSYKLSIETYFEELSMDNK